jgi:hypothetical protein
VNRAHQGTGDAATTPPPAPLPPATAVRPAGQTFESCPAATGQADTDGCEQYPDRAHRCGIPRTPHIQHVCTCHFAWLVR